MTTPRSGAGGKAVHLALLLAGPVSSLLAIAILFLRRGEFAYGAGEPTAGRPEAWTAVWLAIGIVTLGHLISFVYASFVLVARLVRHQRIGVPLGLCLAYDVLAGLSWVTLLLR